MFRCVSACLLSALVQHAPLLYAFNNCRSLRDARFARKAEKQSFYATLGQRLGIGRNDIVVLGSGYCGTNTLHKGADVGAGGVKVCGTRTILLVDRSLRPARWLLSLLSATCSSWLVVHASCTIAVVEQCRRSDY